MMGRKNTMGIRSVTDTLGIERGSGDRGPQAMARILGWVSLGLGAAALAGQPRVSQLCGVEDSPVARTAVRITGVRELGHAGALLIPRRPVWGAWSRVAGDVMDLTACRRAMRNRSGARRRRLTYVTMAVAGITALDLYASVRAARGRRIKDRMADSGRVRAAVTVNRSPDEVYRFWHDFENLPRFMYHLQSVRTTGDRRSRWTAKAPARRKVKWEAEIVNDRPNELITWRSVGRTKVPNSGSVRFVPAAGGRGTEVQVELGYSVPGRRLGATVAKVFGENPGQQICDDLRRFKQVIETGEVVRSDSSPEGTAMRQQARQRPAQPLATRGR